MVGGVAGGAAVVVANGGTAGATAGVAGVAQTLQLRAMTAQLETTRALLAEATAQAAGLRSQAKRASARSSELENARDAAIERERIAHERLQMLLSENTESAVLTLPSAGKPQTDFPPFVRPQFEILITPHFHH